MSHSRALARTALYFAGLKKVMRAFFIPRYGKIGATFSEAPHIG